MNFFQLILMVFSIGATEASNITYNTTALFGIPPEEWRCGPGTGDVTKLIIQRLGEGCPLAAADFNHCCAVHDNCYNNQLGVKHCDTQFCSCMDHLVNSSAEAQNCTKESKMACGLVSSFGIFYYRSSKNITSETQRFPEEMAEIKEEYLDLYQKCKSQNVTIASCALNYDLCYRNPDKSDRFCVLSLIRCLDDTKNDRSFDKTCDVAVDTVLYELVNDGSYVMQLSIRILKVYVRIAQFTTTAKSHWIFWVALLCISILIGMICALLIISCIESRRDKRELDGMMERNSGVNSSTKSDWDSMSISTSKSEKF